MVGARRSVTAICEGVLNLVELAYAEAPEQFVALAVKSPVIAAFARAVIAKAEGVRPPKH